VIWAPVAVAARAAWAPGLSGATKMMPVISRYVVGGTVRARWPWVPLPQLDEIDMASGAQSLVQHNVCIVEVCLSLTSLYIYCVLHSHVISQVMRQTVHLRYRRLASKNKKVGIKIQEQRNWYP
jgi:hypothetical protein